MKALRSIILAEAALLLLFIIIYFIYFEFFAMAIGSQSAAFDAGVQGAAQDGGISAALEGGRPSIVSTAVLDGKTLTVDEEIVLAEPQKEVWLNVPSSIFAATLITKIEPDFERAVSLNDGAALKILFESGAERIKIGYRIELKEGGSILSYRDGAVLLTEFLITPAVFSDGEPVLCEKIGFGDPFVYGMHDYEIRLTAPSEYTAFAPGLVSQRAEGGSTLYYFSAEFMRDFPIALIKNPKVATSRIGDIDVTYVNLMPEDDIVREAFDFMEENVGEYPYNEFFIVALPLSQNGMEFSRMIFVSDAQAGKKDFSKLLCHEIFHQWFYGAVGTDQINEPYIDEGLVTYLSKLVQNEKCGANYRKALLDLKLGNCGSKAQYTSLTYGDGAAFYANIFKKADMPALLRLIYKKYYGKIMTKDDLLSELR